MNSFNPDDSELENAINKAKLPPSSSKGDVSASPPSSDSLSQLIDAAKDRYLFIGRLPHVVPLLPEVKTETDHILVETRLLGFIPVRRGHWTPAPPPIHPDPSEANRRLQLWYRLRRWEGTPGSQLLAKFLENNLGDCSVNDDYMEPSCPPESEDVSVLCPVGDGRMGESYRREFDELAQSLGVNIDAFFRADDDLGDGNDSALASKELADLLEPIRQAAQKPPTDLPTLPEWSKRAAKSKILNDPNLSPGVPPASDDGNSGPPIGGKGLGH